MHTRVILQISLEFLYISSEGCNGYRCHIYKKTDSIAFDFIGLHSIDLVFLLDCNDLDLIAWDGVGYECIRSGCNWLGWIVSNNIGTPCHGCVSLKLHWVGMSCNGCDGIGLHRDALDLIWLHWFALCWMASVWFALGWTVLVRIAIDCIGFVTLGLRLVGLHWIDFNDHDKPDRSFKTRNLTGYEFQKTNS